MGLRITITRNSLRLRLRAAVSVDISFRVTDRARVRAGVVIDQR